MALDGPASKDTKFGATPDVEIHEADSKNDQNVAVKDEPATPKTDAQEPEKPKADDKKPEAKGKKPDEPNKDDPENEGPKPPKNDQDQKKDQDQPKAQKNDNDDEQTKLLREIRDGLQPKDNRHPLMKQLDEDMKAYSNRGAEFLVGYEFGYKVSYGLVRAVELSFAAGKWAATPKKAEAGVTAVQGSAAGLSGNPEKIVEIITELLDKKEADKKGPEQKKDQDKKPDGPKKDDNPVAKSKFEEGVSEGMKNLVARMQQQDPETPKQKQPRKSKGGTKLG